MNRYAILGLSALAGCLLASCGGGINCDVPPFEKVAIALTPPALGAGDQVTVVASFDRNVFDNAGFEVMVIDADILDEAGTLGVTNGS